MPEEFETVGVIQAEAADGIAIGVDDRTILIEHDDPSERLIAQPKDGDSA